MWSLLRFSSDDVVAAATAEGVVEGDVVTPAVLVTADDVVAAATAEGVIEGDVVTPAVVVTADDVVADAEGVIEGEIARAENNFHT